MSPENLLLEVRNLKKYFPIRSGVLQRVVHHVRAVDDIDFFIREGETLGLVGESGSGKTTAGQTILRLTEPTGGEIWFYTKVSGKEREGYQRINLASASPKTMKALRHNMQIIFQDPYSSLDPRMSVESIVGEPLFLQGELGRNERRERVRELLVEVGLKAEHMKRYPHEFSGGQRQRIGIARALALHPQLVVADEPVSALDVSIRAQIINLLEDLQEKFHLTYLFITHDLSVVKHISDRVAVMYLGKIVELSPTEELFGNPKHPYTEALISAVPVPDPDFEVKRILLEGDIPSPVNPPPGCHFHTRCQYAEATCRSEAPPFRNLGEDHFASCHFADQLSLKPLTKN